MPGFNDQEFNEGEFNDGQVGPLATPTPSATFVGSWSSGIGGGVM